MKKKIILLIVLFSNFLYAKEFNEVEVYYKASLFIVEHQKNNENLNFEDISWTNCLYTYKLNTRYKKYFFRNVTYVIYTYVDSGKIKVTLRDNNLNKLKTKKGKEIIIFYRAKKDGYYYYYLEGGGNKGLTVSNFCFLNTEDKYAMKAFNNVMRLGEDNNGKL